MTSHHVRFLFRRIEKKVIEKNKDLIGSTDIISEFNSFFNFLNLILINKYKFIMNDNYMYTYLVNTFNNAEYDIYIKEDDRFYIKNRDIDGHEEDLGYFLFKYCIEDYSNAKIQLMMKILDES